MALIYLVEDDDGIGEIESFALKNAGHEVALLTSVSAFWKACKKKLPDLIVMDVMLPDEDGLTTVEKLRKRSDTRRVPVLMVTAKTSELDRVKGLDIGADDYLVKPFAVAELLARLNALVRRQGSYMEENVEYKGFVLNSGDYTISYGGSKVQLRPREFKLIELLLRNAGKIIPRDVILERVWGIESDISENNLDVHIGALRRKLKEIKGETLIKTIRGVGYLAEADDNVR